MKRRAGMAAGSVRSLRVRGGVRRRPARERGAAGPGRDGAARRRGAVVWSIAIGFVGYSLAYSWDTLERWIGRTGLIALVLVGVVAVIAFVRWRRQSRS